MWFYQTFGQEFGPIPWKELEELRSTGVVDDQDLVKSERASEWLPFGIALQKQKGAQLSGAAQTTTPSAAGPAAKSPPKNGNGAGWYYRIEADEFGPFTLPELVQRAARGDLTADTEVRFGNGGWRRAGSVGQVMAAIPFSGDEVARGQAKRSAAEAVSEPAESTPASHVGSAIDGSAASDWGNFEQRRPADEESHQSENWLTEAPPTELTEMESLDELEMHAKAPVDPTFDMTEADRGDSSQNLPVSGRNVKSKHPTGLENWIPSFAQPVVEHSPYEKGVSETGSDEFASLDEIWSATEAPKKKSQQDRPLDDSQKPAEAKQKAPSGLSSVGVKKVIPRKGGDEPEPVAEKLAAVEKLIAVNEEQGPSTQSKLPRARTETKAIASENVPVPTSSRRNRVNFTMPSLSLPQIKMGAILDMKLIVALIIFALALVWQFFPWADVFANDVESHAKLVELFTAFKRAAAQPDEAKWDAFVKSTKATCQEITKDIEKGMKYPRDSRRLLLQVAKNSIPNLLRRCRSGKCPEVAQAEYLLNKAAWQLKLPGAVEPQPPLPEQDSAKK